MIKKAKASKLEVGDKVLIKVLAFDGPHKLVDKFEEGVYTVTDIPNTDIPVYSQQRVKLSYFTGIIYFLFK